MLGAPRMSGSDSQPLPASTVILVRDAPGLTVLMVRRHEAMAFGASAWVFPGGKVSGADASGPAGGPDDHYRLAAIRETFEETGLLIARRPDGSPATAGDCVALQSMRAQVEASPGLFPAMLREAGLHPALDQLTPFAHWITPPFEKRRFDTRFFLAAAPPEQVALHDGREAVDHAWLSPGDILDRRTRGEARLMFPTRLNVELLASCANVADAVGVALRRPVVPVLPVVVERDGQRMLKIPAEAGYSVVEETMENVMR